MIISGKLRAQRAKVMKFKDGYLISTGEPKKHYIIESTRHVMMRQGVLGVKVRIMQSYDPTGERGTSMQFPDTIVIHEPKEAPVVLPPVESMIEEAPAAAAAADAPAEPEQAAQEYKEYSAAPAEDW